MPVLTIRRDEHGLYTKTNGGIYRPEESVYSYPVRGRVTRSKYKERDKVKGGHISQSPHCKVENEIWNLHGPSPEVAKSLGKDTKGIAWQPKP